MENEIVYVLTNSAMPGIVKIGKTTQSDVQTRMNQLYTTGVPVPFECAFAVQVNDCTTVESALHVAFGPYRINPNREYFKIDIEQAIAILKLLGKDDVTPQVNSELNENVSKAEIESGKKLNKRPNFNFEEMGIAIGSTLIFKDGEGQVVVENPRRVEYKGAIMSLTAATKEYMNLDYAVQPSRHWTYEGRLLQDIYDDTYSLDE